MIWIEHDMQLVRDLADKVLVLHNGKELAFGLPDQALFDPGGPCLHRQALIGPSRWKRPPPCTSLRGRRGPPNHRERTAVPTGEFQLRSEI